DALDGLALDLAAQTGSFDELLLPLADPDLPAAERREIEDTVRCRATDLQALAECGALPPEHSLRRAAQAAWTALQAVASSPVEDGVFDLPEISRRSPLAPWKTLIRAIAHFHRNEDEMCMRYLLALDTDTPPARLVPVLQAMMSNTPLPEGHPPAEHLMKGVGGNHADLRRLLEKADHAIEREHFFGDDPRAMKPIRGAANACARLDAPIANRIRRHLWIRAFREGFSIQEVDRAFPMPVLRDSAFWSLMAQYHMLETDLYGGDPLAACAAWEEFASQAVHEGLFLQDSPESAVVYRLMLKLLRDIPDTEMDDLREEYSYEPPPHGKLYRGQPKHIVKGASAFRADQPSAAFFLYPEEVCARIETADPSPSFYREWFDWNRTHGSQKLAEQTMDRWSKAFPQDAEPLLHLMEAAEKRSAYKKALGYLAQAEAVDALNPKVRRACFRLHLGAFKRHFKQNKPHLAAKDLDSIEASPSLDGQDRRAVEAALRTALCIVSGDSEGSDQFQKTAAGVLNDALTAEILCWGVAEHLGVPYKQLPKLGKPSKRLDKGVRAAAMARASALAKDVGLALPLPTGSAMKLRVDLRDHAAGVDTAHLQAFAEARIESENGEMAYYATRAGLLQEGPHLARFMLLRAQTIPRGHPWRRLQCLSAAVELGRSQRNLDVIDEAIDLLNEDPELKWMSDPHSKLKMDAQHLQHVLVHERTQKKAPGHDSYGGAQEKRYYPKCKCGECSEGRRYRPSVPIGPFGFDPFEWDGGEEEEDFGGPPDFADIMGNWDPFGGEMPEELEKELTGIIERSVNKGISFIEIEQALMKTVLEFLKEQGPPPFPESEAGGGKQGNLFDDIPF
ncbi:MAG: hypothetical protein QGG73_06865, partial [Candidatus Hydrogenedentes bacterium]|nr:hypothetical protein [Candidatus Hydrogenedentota bacterium]